MKYKKVCYIPIPPYQIGGTITDNLLENEVGAINIDVCVEKRIMRNHY